LSSLVLAEASTVVPMSGSGPLRGEGLDQIEVLGDASVVCDEDHIDSVGAGADADVVFDASGCTVVPGFVDCHTHLPFFGWRADEDAARLAGQSYEELHRGEGGIYRSARLLSEAADHDVLEFSDALTRSMLATGTTTFETKSGYGLTVDSELRQLRLARALGERVTQTSTTTCLSAHTVPKGRSRDDWIDEVVGEVLPRACEEKLVSACDIYVEAIAFSLDQAMRLAEAAHALGLRMRVHADQLENSRAGRFAAQRAFATADHLNHMSTDDAAGFAESNTVAVLLPGATFTLRQTARPPARRLIEAGAIVALGTDLNPGTSPIHSMPFVIALACRLYGLRPMEALAAATVNSAFALGRDDIGRIAPGLRADLVVLDAPSFDEVPYRPDHDVALATICGGELAYVAERARSRLP